MSESSPPVESLIVLADRSILVADLVGDRAVYSVDPRRPARVVASEMREQSFDVAPIRDTPVTHFLCADDAMKHPGSAFDAARLIGVELVVSSSLPLSDAVAALAKHPFLFVLSGDRVTGILTRADLQLTPVSLVTFGFILAFESAIDELIGQHLGDSWPEKLPAQRVERVEQVFASRRRRNTEIDRGQCLNLDDRVAIAEKVKVIWTALGFNSRASFNSGTKDIKSLRDVLAHGGNLLDVTPDGAVAAGLFASVRHTAIAAWSAIGAAASQP
jgi:CBS domain-containing protein